MAFDLTSNLYSQRIRLIANLFSVYVLWGSTYLFIHYMTEQMPPLYMAGCRLLVAGVLLYLFARLRGDSRPSVTDWLSAGSIGILLLTIANGGMTIALQYVPTGVAALLAAMVPLFIMILNWLTFSQVRPGKLSVMGMLAGLIGILMLIKPGSFKETSSESWVGIVIIIITNISWATGMLLSGRIRLPGQLISSAIQMLVGGGVLLLVSLVMEPVNLGSIGHAPPKAIGALLYLVLFGSIIGFSSFSWLTRNASPQLVSTHSYVNPLVAMLLGWTFAGESFSIQAIFASLVILSGVVLISIGNRRR